LLTFDRLREIAFGEMAMDEDVFDECHPKYFRLRLFGMREAQQQQYRNQWELSRWMAATIISPHLVRPISPNKLMRFPWEKSDRDDIVATVAKHKDIFAKLTPPAEA
jgi:hypothetical protein